MDKSKVSISRCNAYEKDKINAAIDRCLKDLDIGKDFFKDKKILLKPNLLSSTPPQKAVTTHPVFLEAVIDRLLSYGVRKENMLIADSPGIAVAYDRKGLEETYKTTGLLDISQKTGIRLNYDTGMEMISLKEGQVVKRLEIIKPAVENDMIINLPKFKTHNLTTITGAVKNLYGTVHGRQKTLYHTKFLELAKFYQLLFDIITFLKPAVNIMDGIIGLEGEGPGTSGTPRKVGLVLASKDPVAMDILVSMIMGIDLEGFPLQKTAKSRGFHSAEIGKIDILGASIDELIIKDFKKPKTRNLDRITENRFFSTYFLPFMRNSLNPRPVPDPKKCNLCETCIKVCPEQCITLVNSKIRVDYNNCIRCYCCSEMCPQGAMALKDSFMSRQLSKIFSKR